MDQEIQELSAASTRLISAAAPTTTGLSSLHWHPRLQSKACFAQLKGSGEYKAELGLSQSKRQSFTQSFPRRLYFSGITARSRQWGLSHVWETRVYVHSWKKWPWFEGWGPCTTSEWLKTKQDSRQGDVLSLFSQTLCLTENGLTLIL